MSPEDQLFLLKSEYAKERRESDEEIDDLSKLLQDIWSEKGLTRKLWERIAEHLEIDEEEIPVIYDPEPITQSDFLKLQQRIKRIERKIWGENIQQVAE